MNGSCLTCGREWTGHSEAHCARGCSHFTSDRAFDRHRAAPQSRDECYDPATLRNRSGAKVFEVIQRTHGPVFRFRRTDANPFTRKAAPSFPDADQMAPATYGTTESGESRPGSAKAVA